MKKSYLLSILFLSFTMMIFAQKKPAKSVFNFDFETISKDFLFSHPDQPNLDSINEKHLEIITKTYTGLFYILEKKH